MVFSAKSSILILGWFCLIGFSPHSGVGVRVHKVDVGFEALPGKKWLADFEWAQNFNPRSKMKWLGCIQYRLHMAISYLALPDSWGKGVHPGRQRTQHCLEKGSHTTSPGIYIRV